MSPPRRKADPVLVCTDLVGDLITELNKNATSAGAYLQGDHAAHTWGVKIPHMAFQWLIGGSDVLPCQRYLGLSGAGKSFKSSLMIEIGNWFLQQNGVHIILDTENKTSPSMLDAQSWWNGVSTANRVYKVCTSTSEWQTMVVKAVEMMRAKGAQPVGHRVPLLLDIDSLVARGTEGEDRALRAEGSAPERGYPVVASQVTKFLENINLLGTTSVIGWVQHMKVSMEQTGGYGVVYKEKGPTASQFHNSIHLRVTKGASFRKASHPSAPFPEYSVEGHDIWLRTAMSCLGPGERSLRVQLCWQFVPDEDGQRRQVMWWDWDGALGNLLFEMKYNAKFKPAMFTEDKRQLDEALHFTGTQKEIKCEELELPGVSTYEFGKVIRENEAVSDRIRSFLGLTSFQSVQDADIDFTAGDMPAEKKKKR